MEADEDLQDVIERSREKVARKAVNKLIRDDGPSSRSSPAIDEGRNRKKKGRPPKNPVIEDYEPSGSNGKRKRGIKAASVTPSIAADDDDNGRDSVSLRAHVRVLVSYLHLEAEAPQDKGL